MYDILISILKYRLLLLFFIVITCASIHFLCLWVTLFLLFFCLFTHHVNEEELNYCYRDYY